jgi:SAM-dependent methyltransferase
MQTDVEANKHTHKEVVACSICGALPPERAEFQVRGFRLVRCPQCKVLRVCPRLTAAALKRYYNKDYWISTDSISKGYFNYFADEANIKRTFRRRLTRIMRLLPQAGRMLDVGCANGFLLEEAGTLGWDALGVEWSQPAVMRARSKTRPRIIIGSLSAVELEPDSLDLITFWDYLEHSPAPKQDCQKAAALLRPGGILSVIIPDAGSLLARLRGRRWEEYQKPEEHLYFFTGRQLEHLLSGLGVTVVRRKWEGKYASLQFAFSRFRPGDGWLYFLARSGQGLARLTGLAQQVVYVNPFDKLHLLCQKELW